MSPIGRIFVVLNLLLAGGFVMTAGTYLQKSTDWKTQYDDLKAASGLALDQEKGLHASTRGELEDVKRRHLQADTNRTTLAAANTELEAENARLGKQLSDLQGNLAALQASYQTVADAVDRATQDSATARTTSIESQSARDEAIRARETAEADLRNANTEIDQLKGAVAERDTEVAALAATVKEKDILLAVVSAKMPGLLTQAQPTLGGTVQHVGAGGKLVTITVTDNPEGAELKPGYSFAIFRGNDYKGEAQVTDVEGNHAFCRVEPQAGKTIDIGDSAKTNTF